jgi:hypothetical protein
MVDEHFHRLYREGRGELNGALNSGFHTLGARIMAAFHALHRIAWESPWAPAERAKCN